MADLKRWAMNMHLAQYLRWIVAFVVLSIAGYAKPSDLLLIGSNLEDLRKAHGAPVASESSDSTLVFRTEIDGVQYSLVYRLEKGVAISALCILPAKSRRFLDSIPSFLGLLARLMNGRSAAETAIRLNGLELTDQNSHPGLERPNNFIRITGNWAPGFYFHARLDGDEITDIKGAMVTSFGFSVQRDVLAP